MQLNQSDLSKKGNVRFAAWLQNLVQQGVDSRRGLKSRWELNEQVYRNDPAVAGIKLFDNVDPRALPVMSPRINRIVNTSASAIEGPGVWFQAIPEDGDMESSEELEKAVQTMLERGRFPLILRRALVTSALCGVSIVRLHLTDDGLSIDHIHPNDFVVSPTYGLDLKDAHLVGHRFYIPRWKVEQRAKDGLYPLYKDTPSQTSPDDDPSGRDPSYDKSYADSATNDPATEMVELWELIVRLDVDGKAGMYRVVYNDKDTEVYQVEPYPYDRPWYFDVRLTIPEEGKFWPANSVAQNIVGICLMKGDLVNLMGVGSMATCAPPTYVTGMSLGKKLQGLSIAQVVEIPGAGQDARVLPLPMTFDPKAMPLVLDYLDGAIEAQTGISENRLNAQVSGGERVTAREIAAMESAATQNEGSYAMLVSLFLNDIASFVQQLLKLHGKKIVAAYKGSVANGAVIASRNPVRWQVTGQSANNSPQMVLGKLEALLNLASNPLSGYSYERVEKAVVQLMGLPMNTQRLEKTNDEKMASKAAMAQIAQQQASGGDAGLDGGLAPQAGVQLPS